MQELQGPKTPYLIVDGSWNAGVTRMGCGGMLADENGSWISGFSISFGHGNAFISELLALDHGLRLVWNLGYRHITCATDCKDAITALNTHDTSSY